VTENAAEQLRRGFSAVPVSVPRPLARLHAGPRWKPVRIEPGSRSGVESKAGNVPSAGRDYQTDLVVFQGPGTPAMIVRALAGKRQQQRRTGCCQCEAALSSPVGFHCLSQSSGKGYLLIHRSVFLHGRWILLRSILRHRVIQFSGRRAAELSRPLAGSMSNDMKSIR